MRVVAAAAIAGLILAAVPVGDLIRAEEGLTRRDAQGPVTVIVTLLPSPTPGGPIKAKVVLDTHSMALDGVALDRVVVLRMPDGTEMSPTAVEQARGGGHHREAVLVFAPLAPMSPVQILVRQLGGVPERVFRWETP